MQALAEYYFDTETTGLSPQRDKIVTIQWQRLDWSTGGPVGRLEILKEWESSEKEVLARFLPKVMCENPFDFVFVGKNLLFDFAFLSSKLEKYGLAKLDLSYWHRRPSLDLKHVLILINNGRFKGYNKVLGELPKVDVPKLYSERKYPEIIKYVREEAKLFLKGYQILKREAPSLAKHLKPSSSS